MSSLYLQDSAPPFSPRRGKKKRGESDIIATPRLRGSGFVFLLLNCCVAIKESCACKEFLPWPSVCCAYETDKGAGDGQGKKGKGEKGREAKKQKKYVQGR